MVATKNMRRVHVCCVRGNTVWSHMMDGFLWRGVHTFNFSSVFQLLTTITTLVLTLADCVIVPVLLHGSECWCLRREDERRILTAEMTWLRRLLSATRRDKMRNETVRGILCQETTLADNIAAQRLNWFGHVSRMGSERLPAEALHWYINGKRN